MLKILIVEDDEIILQLTQEMISLQFDSVKITTATSGQEAISVLKSEPWFDFIISDYQMPNGNGVEVLKYAQSSKNSGYFILYTSHIDPILPASTDERFLGVIEKFEIDRVTEKMYKCLSTSELLKTKLVS